MESFRWVKHSPIYESNLAPLNQGQYSPITLGWFGPKGWNSLLIELFRPQSAQMAPEGVESDFCLQCWIETLGVQQIFLTFSVEWSKWVDLFLTACWTQACSEGKGTNGTHRSHARCRPDPIPQPVKVGHTTGVYVRYPFRTVAWVFLESLTICRCHYKGSTFFSVI